MVRVLSRRAVVIAVAVAVLVLAGVGTAIFLLTRDDSPDASGGSAAPGPGGASGAPASAAPTSVPEPAPEPGGSAPADTGDVKAVAERAVRAINAHDPEALRKLSCDPDAVGPAESTPPDARVELASNPELTGDTATVELKLIIGDASTITPLPLRKSNGTWCVD